MLKPKSSKYSEWERIDELKFDELTSRYEYVYGKNRKVESFYEILDKVQKHYNNAKMMIESKADSKISLVVDELVKAFQEYNLYHKAVVGSFNPHLLYSLRAKDPTIVTLLLVKEKLLSPLFDEKAEFVPKFISKFPAYLRFIILNLVSFLDWIYLKSCCTFLPSLIGVGVIGFEHHLVMNGMVNAESFLNAGYQVNTWTVNDNKIKQDFVKRGISVTTDCLFE